jgi:hypothetical protein
MKLLTDIIYKCSQKARVFVPGKPFQPNLMFTGKAIMYHWLQVLMLLKKFFIVDDEAK